MWTSASKPVRPMIRWAAIIAVTVVSTGALDIVATTTGALLAASHVLDGASQPAVFGFLEAPYYASAFGTALLSDTVDSTDALVFLAGTNIGAAAYEYGVARLSRAFLDKRARQRVPSRL